MARKRYTAEEIIKLLRLIEIDVNTGKTVELACKSQSITVQTYYRWRKEYGGLELNQAQELKRLKQENARLKKMVAELNLDKDILEEAIKGNY